MKIDFTVVVLNVVFALSPWSYNKLLKQFLFTYLFIHVFLLSPFVNEGHSTKTPVLSFLYNVKEEGKTKQILFHFFWSQRSATQLTF